MGELDLLPGLVVGAAGLVAGIILMLMQRGGGEGTEAEGRRRDLEQQKDQALQALRDLEDVQGTRGIQATSAERSELERRAAEAMRALDQGQAPATAPATPSAPLVSPRAQGFLSGAAVVAVGAAIVFALGEGTTARVEGMSVTGNAPERVAPRPTPGAGETGGAVPGVPPSLSPKPSPAVDEARALVSASPESTQAWADLGWALVEAEGWIDVWNVAGKLLDLSPGHPDGLTLQATVRLAMGMEEQALELVDQALAADPSHVLALSWKGSLLLRSGDRAGAKAVWTQAGKLAPDGGFEELVALADTVDLSARPGAAKMPADHPPAAGSPKDHPAAAGSPNDSPASAGGNRMAGTLSLGAGATPPASGVIFVIARHPGVQRGPPVASLKLPASGWPVSFALTDANVMMGGPLPSSLAITARLDADGNAMTKGETDLHADAGTVQTGTADVQLILN